MKKQINNIKRYRITRAIHWINAFIFFSLALATGYLFDSVSNADERLQVYDNHVSVGLLFICLILVRIFWSVFFGEERTEFFGRWQQIIAHINFFILHVLMIMVVISGIIAVMSSGKDMRFFVYNIPHIEWLVDHEIKYYAHEVHLYMVYASYVFLAIHLFGALTHTEFLEPFIKRLLKID